MDVKNQTKLSIDNKKLVTSTKKLLTIKQLEREVAHRFQAINRQMLGCYTQKASCTIFNTYVNVVVENAATPLELAMYEQGQMEMLLSLRQAINQTLKAQLDAIIPEITSVGVKDLVCELNFDTNRLIAIAILTEFPTIRKKNG